MANLWSEVEKIFIWKERGDEKAMKSAFNRAITILQGIRTSGSKSANSEASIIEDILIDLTKQQQRYAVSRSQMSLYLRPFVSRLSA